MALTVVWEKAAVTMEDGTEKILRRGEALPDTGVSDFHRSVLTMIGAVRDLNAAVAVVQQAADAEVTPEQEPAPAVLPPEVPPVQPVQQTSTTTDPKAVEPADDTTATAKPSVSDNKDAWERYAVSKGYYTEAEAESMTKAKRVAEVNARENA